MNAKSDPPATSQTVSRRERRAAERAARRGGAPAVTTSKTRPGPSALIISVAAIIIGFVVIAALIGISGGLGGGSAMAAVEPAQITAPPQDLRVGRSLGDPAAPVKIEVFEDFQCPACGAYTKSVEPLLLAPDGPVADGTVFVTIKDFPFLGQESLDAAVAARVAEALDGKFWDYHGILFHNQHGENQGAFTRDRLADMAEVVGLDRQAFLDGLDDPAHLQAIQAEKAEGADLGVNSTPTLFVNGQILRGVPSWDDLSTQIEAAATSAGAA
jgi:protein-disulfide isomerase